MGMTKIISLFLFLFFSHNAQAHPVSFKNAVSVMSWNQPFMTDNWITYSLNHRSALAARTMRLETLEGRQSYFGPQFDYLVKRWNNMHSQANVYVYGSYGVLHAQQSSRAAGLGGIEVDAESRKHYIALKYEKMWSDFSNMDRVEARLGVAPYESEFHEISSWFMIQYQYHPMLIRKDVITPLIRLFYKSVMFEGGVSTDGDWMTNFMFHF